jgi:hypothetical protein
MGKSARSVTIRFQAGMLVIEAGESTVEVFARGDWPTAIMGDALWVRVLAKKMPAGDPIRPHVQDRRLYSAPSSLPCASFRDPLTDGFGVNLTAAGLRQGTFAT